MEEGGGGCSTHGGEAGGTVAGRGCHIEEREAIGEDLTNVAVVVLKSQHEMDGDGGGSGDGCTASGINFEQERAFPVPYLGRVSEVKYSLDF